MLSHMVFHVIITHMLQDLMNLFTHNWINYVEFIMSDTLNGENRRKLLASEARREVNRINKLLGTF